VQEIGIIITIQQYIRRKSEMSETLKVIKERRSIRKYQDKRVPQEIIDQIMEAGTYAPTGMGKQSPIIIQVKDKDLRDNLSELNRTIMGANIDPFYGAQDVLIVLADKSIPTYLYDGALVMGNLMLAAKDLGVDSCYIFRAKEEFEMEAGKAILKALGIEGDYEGIGHVILGYADGEQPKAAPRKANYIYKI
jgi:nitroreductase